MAIFNDIFSYLINIIYYLKSIFLPFFFFGKPLVIQ